MDIEDVIALIHPLLAVTVVFPLLGIVINRAWKTRSRRLETATGGKSKIPPVVGQEHVGLGRWLAGAVVGVSLLGIAYGIFDEGILPKHIWSKNPFQVVFIVVMFAATIVSLVFLYKARERLWRGVFATLTGAGLVILGCQEGVYRLDNEWYWSHYYIGIASAMLMIFSLAIIPDIYQDRSNRWRYVHIALNCVALLLFLGQGMTGTRSLLEIPLSWQKPYIYQCDFAKKTCSAPPPQHLMLK